MKKLALQALIALVVTSVCFNIYSQVPAPDDDDSRQTSGSTPMPRR